MFICLPFFIYILPGDISKGVDTGAISWLLEMFTDDNHMLMQAIYFFFGIGTFLSPLIIFNFLSEESNSLTLESNSLNSLDSLKSLKNFNVSIVNSSIELEESSIRSDISIPFFMISFLILMTALLNLISYIFIRYIPSEDSLILRLKEDLINNNVEDKKPNYGTQKDTESGTATPIMTGWTRKLTVLVGLAATILCFYESFENITFEYFASFLIYSPFIASEASAARMATLMSASFTIVRGLAIIGVRWLKPKTLIILDAFCMFVGVTLVYYSINSVDLDAGSNTKLITGVILWGAGMATFFPSLYSYLEEHIRMTDTICSILHISCAVVSPFEAILVGNLLVTLPEILLYACYASLAITAIALSAFECAKVLST